MDIVPYRMLKYNACRICIKTLGRNHSTTTAVRYFDLQKERISQYISSITIQLNTVEKELLL